MYCSFLRLPPPVYMMSCWCCVDSLTTWGGEKRRCGLSRKEEKTHHYLCSGLQVIREHIFPIKWSRCCLEWSAVQASEAACSRTEGSVWSVSTQGRCKLQDWGIGQRPEMFGFFSLECFSLYTLYCFILSGNSKVEIRVQSKMGICFSNLVVCFSLEGTDDKT